jgi:ABC-type lipoprotein release transport system permease subunit
MKKASIFLIGFLVLMNGFAQESIFFSNNGHISFQNQDYMLQFILVNDLKATLNIWNVPNVPPRLTPSIKTRINEPISLFVVYATDKDSINLMYNLKIKKPNGTFSEKSYNGLKIADKVIVKQVLYTGDQLPTIIFDEKEELGKYQFIIEVYDDKGIIKIFALEFDLLKE